MESNPPGLGLRMENPFTLKVGQVMTGFGIGCGIGIGVGRPLNLGAIPVVDQVMSATRGATSAFSGIGSHVNTFISRMGFKSIEAGIGCGLGFGHGFGVVLYIIELLVPLRSQKEEHVDSLPKKDKHCLQSLICLAVKPGVVHHIQSCIGQGLAGLMKNWKIMPDLSSAGKFGPMDSLGDGVRLASQTAGQAFQNPAASGMQIASQTAERAFQSPIGSSIQLLSQTAERTLKDPTSGSFTANSEQNTNAQITNKIKFDEEVGRLQSENKILQLLLRHQQLIEELKEENTNLRNVLIEELHVSPDKLNAGTRETENLSKNNGSDCFKNRRRARR